MIKASVSIIMIMTMMTASIFATSIIYKEAKGDKDEEICSNYDGEWNDNKNKCEIEDNEERADYEDALCDDPKASEKFEACQEEKKQGHEEKDGDDDDKKETKKSHDEEELKEVCDKYGDKAEWDDGECKWKLSDLESSNWGFGDECGDEGFMQRQSEFCNAD
jgi:hypothetical protein